VTGLVKIEDTLHAVGYQVTGLVKIEDT